MNFFAQRRSTLLLSGIVVLFALTLCNGEGGGGSTVAEVKKNTGNFTDSRDGKTYKSKKMPDGKTWMGENLNYETGNSWCYGGDNSNCEKYGRMYDWKTAKTACLSGWHLPSLEEWDVLAQAVGGRKYEDSWHDWEDAGMVLKSTSGWYDWDGNNSGNGTDAYGFSALPGGRRYDSVGSFYGAGCYGNWWTATENSDGYAYFRNMHYGSGNLYEYRVDKVNGFSVRCVGD